MSRREDVAASRTPSHVKKARDHVKAIATATGTATRAASAGPGRPAANQPRAGRSETSPVNKPPTPTPVDTTRASPNRREGPT